MTVILVMVVSPESVCWSLGCQVGRVYVTVGVAVQMSVLRGLLVFFSWTLEVYLVFYISFLTIVLIYLGKFPFGSGRRTLGL